MSILQRLLGWRELYTTFRMEEYSRVLQILGENGIKYNFDADFTGTRNRAGGRIVGFGERIELETQYYIYVRKEDLERARLALRELRNKG